MKIDTSYKKIVIMLLLTLAFYVLMVVKVKAQTVNVPVTTSTTNNGTTVTTTTTPTSIVPTPNTPNYGDITNTITSNVSVTTTTPGSPANTGNVLPNNFCSQWTGTQVSNGQTSDLGCNYLTGKGSSSYAEWEKSLANIGISSPLQKNGFTQSADAQTGFFWNNPQSLTMSQSVIDNSTGETITQNRTLSKGVGGDPNYMTRKYLDNIIIGSNNNLTGYTSKLRFDFSSSGSGSTWQGADVTSANLSIAYTGAGSSTTVNSISISSIIISCESLNTCYTPPAEITNISTNITNALPPTLTGGTGGTNTFVNITGELTPVEKPTIMSSPAPIEMSNINSPKENLTSMAPTSTVSMATSGMSGGANSEPKAEPKTEVKSEASESKPSVSSNNSSTGGSSATTTSDKETANTSKTTDTKQESKSEDKQTSSSKSDVGENKKTEGSQTSSSNEKSVSDTKTSTNEKVGDVKTNAIESKVKNAIEKVERELKSIEAKTKAIQEIKLDGMKAGAPNMSTYENRIFYEPKYLTGVPNPDFFLQMNISQKPIYENVVLPYAANDPIGKRQAAQREIENEMNDIIMEIEKLKTTNNKG